MTGRTLRFDPMERGEETDGGSHTQSDSSRTTSEFSFWHALGYFRRGETGERAFLVGAILSFAFAILVEIGLLVTTILAVVPAVALVGYFARVLASSADGATAPPAFSVSRRLLRDGLLAAVVAGSYLLVPAVVLAGTVGGALSRAVAAPQTVPAIQFYAGSVVVLLTALGFAYLAPAAVVLALRRRSLRAGFARDDIGSIVSHAAYFYAWTVALGLLAVGVLVATWLAGVPVVGPALAVFVGFYTLATATHLVGRGCVKATSGRP